MLHHLHNLHTVARALLHVHRYTEATAKLNGIIQD